MLSMLLIYSISARARLGFGWTV